MEEQDKHRLPEVAEKMHHCLRTGALSGEVYRMERRSVHMASSLVDNATYVSPGGGKQEQAAA